MVWVNINIIMILWGNELNIAIKKVWVEKMISDEMKSDQFAMDSELVKQLEKSDDSHSIIIK